MHRRRGGLHREYDHVYYRGIPLSPSDQTGIPPFGSIKRAGAAGRGPTAPIQEPLEVGLHTGLLP